MEKKRLLIGISGASGAPLAVELLRKLKSWNEIETHLILSKSAVLTLEQETDYSPEELQEMAAVCYDNQDLGAGPSSGSFRTIGMVVVPCSMKTVAGIASGYSDTLLLRAADVTLKERRKLVLVARESPLSCVHLRNLYQVSRDGAVVLPPVLGYYNHPQSVDDCTHFVVQRILSQFGLDEESYEWKGSGCI